MRSLAAQNLAKIKRLPLWAVAAMISRFIPRNPWLWVFGRRLGFGDGPGDLMEFARANEPRAKCIWLVSTSPKEAEKLRQCGVDAVYAYSIKGWWTALRASITVISSGFGDVNGPGAYGSRILQLWHGSPLKQLGQDTKRTFTVEGHSYLRLLYTFALTKSRSRISWFVAPSPLVAERFASAFGLERGQLWISGDPRTDRLLCESAESRTSRRAQLAAYWERDGRPDSRTRLLLYAPTWRDGESWRPEIAPSSLRQLEAMLERHNALLAVRAHPFDPSVLAGFGGIRRVVELPSSVFPNVNDWLTQFVLLITDYSSIAMDYSLLVRPMLFFAPDLEVYTKTRGLYESFDSFAGAGLCQSWDELIERIGAVLGGDTTDLINAAQQIKSRYHTYDDGQNCARVLQQMVAQSEAKAGARLHDHV